MNNSETSTKAKPKPVSKVSRELVERNPFRFSFSHVGKTGRLADAWIYLDHKYSKHVYTEARG